jgi:hypothetical protein
MYKPNGEERMNEQDAKRRREELAERRMERIKAADNVASALGTEIFATMMRASDPREELIHAGFAGLR